MAVTPRMLVNYRERVMPSMREQFGRENPMSLPRLTKVVVSIGLGKAVAESQNRVRENKRYQEAVDLLKLATGQTDNVAEVFSAVRKADIAFSLLMQIRNQLVDAYTEIRNIRI